MLRSFAKRLRMLFCLVAMILGATSCKGSHQPSSADFVGKWKSSKLETPLYLFGNSEWEIKNENGGVLQYGIWEYRDNRIIWSIKSGGQIIRDVNRVLSFNDQEFKLEEGAGVTTFVKLERLADTH